MKMKPFSWINDKMREKLCKISTLQWRKMITENWRPKSKERDETLQGTKCEILLGLAFILFTLIWKIKGRYNQSNQMKAQCEEEMTII